MRLIISFSLLLILASCKRDGVTDNSERIYYQAGKFCMGADLSYVNQILDYGGTYLDSGSTENPYNIFRKYGANSIRFRLFNNPTWTSTVYDPPISQMYNDFNDVKKGIEKAKSLGMTVCLNFHYSDTWADPSRQEVPAAWKSLSLNTLRDSIYNYTYRVLTDLDKAGLMPEYVQTGNEINPGFLLPQGERWNGNEVNMINLLNAAAKAVRDAAALSTVKSKIIIHIAQPENADAWLEGMAGKGLFNYDIIGLSYYYIWSSVDLEDLSDKIRDLRLKYLKDVMIMETAYPWTTANADSYGNIIQTDKLIPEFQASEEGQYSYLKALTQEIIDGGGKGIYYWEPAWITSQMKDKWGTGSSWDCNTLFDSDGNTLKGIRYMFCKYTFSK